jgi:hypothetical protein
MMNTRTFYVNGLRIPHDAFEVSSRRNPSGPNLITVKISSEKLQLLNIGEVVVLSVDEYRGGRMVTKFEFDRTSEEHKDNMRKTDDGSLEFKCQKQNSEIHHG